MTRPHHCEMPYVEGGELALTQPLDDREHGGVHKPDAEVAVGRAEVADATVVLASKVLDDERSAVHVVEQVEERLDSESAVAPVIDFGEDGSRDYAALRRAA